MTITRSFSAVRHLAALLLLAFSLAAVALSMTPGDARANEDASASPTSESVNHPLGSDIDAAARDLQSEQEGVLSTVSPSSPYKSERSEESDEQAPDSSDSSDDPNPTPDPGPDPEPDAPTLLRGWNYIDGKWYWGDSSGKPQTGWLSTGGKWYYLNPGSGAMATGWLWTDNRWYYLDKSGAMKTGWAKIGGKWYYLNKSGYMAEGWKKLSGTWYYLNPGSGAMATGWLWTDNRWYYLDKSGAMKTGWAKIGGKWYYLNKSGYMAEGWKKLSGTWYYLNPGSGAMATGWIQPDKTWYYLKSSGAMVTGRHVIDGRASLFDGSGAWLGYENVERLFTMWAQPETSSTKWLILVDTSRCKVGVFWGSKGHWELQRMMDCAPGKASTPTKKGRFTVGSKGYYFDSGAARCFYFTQFSGNYLFHSVLYYQNSKPTSIMDGRVGMGLSHGCVRLKLSNAKWIYDNIPRGTKVYVW